MTFMLDTNIFNAVLDGSMSIAPCHRLLTTGVQAGELKATKDAARREALLRTFIDIDTSTIPASSMAFGVEGAGWGEAYWNDGSGNFQKMLGRLNELEPKKDKLNPVRDIIIAETAIKNGATLVTNDRSLRQVVLEFGGNAIDLEAFLSLGPEDPSDPPSI